MAKPIVYIMWLVKSIAGYGGLGLSQLLPKFICLVYPKTHSQSWGKVHKGLAMMQPKARCRRSMPIKIHSSKFGGNQKRKVNPSKYGGNEIRYENIILQ